MGRGIDPEPNLRKAIRILEGALARPRHADLLWNNLGNCHALLGHWQLLHGRDPSAELERASDCLLKAAAVRPWVGHASSRGSVLLDLASYRSWQGQDPGKDLDGALAAFREALQLNPNSYQAQEGAAEALLLRTESAIASGRSAGPDLEAALGHLGKALALNPGLATARWRQVQGWSLRARVGGNVEDLQNAQKAARLERTDGPEVLWASAQAHWAMARAAGEPARSMALAALRSAAARNPWDGRYPYLEGRLLLLLNRPSEAHRALARAGDLNANLRRTAQTAAGLVPQQ